MTDSITTNKEVCPLGMECVEDIDGVKHTCKWLMSFTTTKPDGKTVQVTQCAAIWGPTLTVELLTMLRVMFDAMMKGKSDIPWPYKP